MRLVGCVVALGLAACGGGGTDYFASSAAEGGAEIAARVCTDAFACGVVSFSCDDDLCTVSYMTGAAVYGNEDACLANESAVYTRRINGCITANLTDAEQDAVNACLGYHHDGCLTEAELDEIEATVNAGGDPSSPECQEAAGALERCDACADAPTSPPCTGAA